MTLLLSASSQSDRASLMETPQTRAKPHSFAILPSEQQLKNFKPKKNTGERDRERDLRISLAEIASTRPSATIVALLCPFRGKAI
jgi:hypothetical protein